MAQPHFAPDIGTFSSGSEIFDVGRNCFAVAPTRHIAFLVDGEEYFRSFILAAQQATRSIAILAWDFNPNMLLHFDTGGGLPPAKLGDFLNWLVRRRRDLHIHILDWDYPLLFGTDRDIGTYYGIGWHPHRRVHLAYDNTHPVGGSHHQKIVVIDDALAFIGGFDLTARRWDTCSHAADNLQRLYGNKAYPPFHDLMMAVDGEAARVLGGLVRERWLAATGHALPAAAGATGSRWPSAMRIDLGGVDVAFARTMPELRGHPGVTEVEALYLDMIAAARRRIYIENQYFTAYRIGDALAARLAESDGPEIAVVVRLFSHGWLEEHTMHVLRTRLIQRLREADRYNRFRVYYPHVEGLGENLCLDLHSKLMIVDDEILRIGSANLSNRSMGMDTECDAAIEARGNPRVACAIRAFRNRLLAEHLDVPAGDVEAADQHLGSLHATIDALAGRSRTLRELERLPNWSETVMELAGVGDPASPLPVEQLIDDFSPERLVATPEEADHEPAPKHWRPPHLRAMLVRLTSFVLAVAALTLLWRYTPLSEWADARQITDWAHRFAHRPWAPLVILAAYTPACLVMFPRPLITLAAVVAFGPIFGFVYGIAGILLAALTTYLIGMRLPQHTVRHVAGSRLLRVAETLRRGGVVAITALRLVPLAPFAVEGIVAAAIGIRLLPFLVGTLLGMLPGTLATTVFGGQIEAGLEDPSRINVGLLTAVVLLLLGLSLVVRRWLVAQHRRLHHGDAGQRAR